MAYKCPKCNNYGIEWDARAKILLCYYDKCNHVIRIPGQKEVPTENQIHFALAEDSCSKDVPSPDYDAQDAIVSLESLRTSLPLHCRGDEDVTEPYDEILRYLVSLSRKGL